MDLLVYWTELHLMKEQLQLLVILDLVHFVVIAKEKIHNTRNVDVFEPVPMLEPVYV